MPTNGLKPEQIRHRRRRILLRIVVHWIGIPTRLDCYAAYQNELRGNKITPPTKRTYYKDWDWVERQMNMGRAKTLLEQKETAVERARLIASDAALEGDHSSALRGVQLESDIAGYVAATEDEVVSAPRRAAEFDKQRRETEHDTNDSATQSDDGEPADRRLL